MVNKSRLVFISCLLFNNPCGFLLTTDIVCQCRHEMDSILLLTLVFDKVIACKLVSLINYVTRDHYTQKSSPIRTTPTKC